MFSQGSHVSVISGYGRQPESLADPFSEREISPIWKIGGIIDPPIRADRSGCSDSNSQHLSRIDVTYYLIDRGVDPFHNGLTPQFGLGGQLSTRPFASS
jgi:hypothetical protein